jgi:hypothetical protein
LQLRKKARAEADTNVTDLIAGYKEIDCMYQLTVETTTKRNEQSEGEGGTANARERVVATSGDVGKARQGKPSNRCVTVYRPPSSTPRTSSVVLKSARKGHKSVSSVS